MPLSTATLKAGHKGIRHLASGEPRGNLGPCTDPWEPHHLFWAPEFPLATGLIRNNPCPCLPCYFVPGSPAVPEELVYFGSVQPLSPVRLCSPMDCSTPGLPIHHHNFQSLLKLMSIESAMPSNHLILCRPLLLPLSIFPSIRVFSNKSVLHIRWSRDWSFSISPSSEYSGLISFRMDWLDLLAWCT